jgi:putative FmdB family regulatory protein
MPMYSYLCKACGKKFDLLIGVTAEKTEFKCKYCNSKNIEKTLSSFSVGSARGRSSPGTSCSTGACPTCF